MANIEIQIIITHVIKEINLTTSQLDKKNRTMEKRCRIFVYNDILVAWIPKNFKNLRYQWKYDKKHGMGLSELKQKNNTTTPMMKVGNESRRTNDINLTASSRSIIGKC